MPTLDLPCDVANSDVHVIRPRVIDSARIDSAKMAELAAILPPSGSVVIYYASTASEFIGNLGNALSRRDEDCLKAIKKQVQHLSSTACVSEENLVSGRRKSDSCLFDVKGQSGTICQAIGLKPGCQVGMLTLAYEGDPNEIEILEHRRPEDDRGYQYLVCVRASMQTPIEKSLPTDVSERIFVGSLAGSSGDGKEANERDAIVVAQDNRAPIMGGPTPQIEQELQAVAVVSGGQLSTSAPAHVLIRARQAYLDSLS